MGGRGGRCGREGKSGFHGTGNGVSGEEAAIEEVVRVVKPAGKLTLILFEVCGTCSSAYCCVCPVARGTWPVTQWRCFTLHTVLLMTVPLTVPRAS